MAMVFVSSFGMWKRQMFTKGVARTWFRGNLKKTHFCLTPLHGNLRLAPSSHGESQAAADESVFVGAGRSEMARPLQAVAAMSWGVLPLFMVVLRNIVFFCLVYGLSLWFH